MSELLVGSSFLRAKAWSMEREQGCLRFGFLNTSKIVTQRALDDVCVFSVTAQADSLTIQMTCEPLLRFLRPLFDRNRAILEPD